MEAPVGYECDRFYQINLLEDSLDYDELVSADVIIYAAAAGSIDTKNPDASLMYRLNVYTPIELSIQLEKIGYNGVLITFGSYMEIGDNQEEGKLFTEDEVVCTTLPATNSYTLSKRLLSRYLKDFHASYINYHFILPNMFSQNDIKPGKRIVPYTINYLNEYKSGNNPKPPVFSSGIQSRQFITVEEMMNTVNLAIEKRIPAGLYNIGGGEFLSIRSLIERLFALYDVPIDNNYFGKEIHRDGSIRSLRIDGRKLYKEIGYLPKDKIENIFSKWT